MTSEDQCSQNTASRLLFLAGSVLFFFSLHCVLFGGATGLRGAAEVPGEGWVGVGVPWFAGDSKDLAGVSSCKEKGALHGTMSCAQAAVVGFSCRTELPGTADPCGSHADVLGSKPAVLGRRCSIGDSVTDLVIGWDSPHFSENVVAGPVNSRRCNLTDPWCDVV